MHVNLVQVPANPQQHPPRSHGGQIIVTDTVIPANQVLNTFRFSQEFSMIKWINKKLRSCGLIATNKMTVHPDPRNRQAQPASEKDVDQAQINRIARAPVDHPIKVTVLRFVIIFFISTET